MTVMRSAYGSSARPRSSVEPSSQTITSCGAGVCPSAESIAPEMTSATLYAAIRTENVGVPRAATVPAGSGARNQSLSGCSPSGVILRMSCVTDVSLIMTAWEPRRDWLDEAVDSALGQRDVQIELIVVDDGSSQPVEELLDRKDPRLRQFRLAHGGGSRAPNKG